MLPTIVDFSEELGVKLYPGQAAALMDYYDSGRPNWLFLAGRRGGKSLISDVCACFEATVPDFEGALRPGEERYILLISVRQDSANLHIENIYRLLKRSKALRELIKERTKERISLSNGVSIISLPASGRSVRGYTASTVILDELAHFVDTQGNNSADAVFDAVAPVLATFGDYGRLIITTTPAARTGIVYELFSRADKGELDDFHITRMTSQELNPKVSDRIVKRAMTRDELSASVEYFAEFADPIASFLDSQSIERAIDYRRKRLEKGDATQRYYMAIDPATMGDRYAFVITHREKDILYLDYSHIMRPPVNPAAAEDLLMELDRKFKPVKIRCDTASTVERLKSKLYHLEYVPFTRPLKLRIFGALKEALNLNQLVLYKDDDLIDELKALQIRNGVDISAPKSGKIKHDDLADCLALCIDALAEPVGGKVTFIPNFIYNEEYKPENWLYDKDGNARDVGHRVNRNPHPEGVTWQNCPHRNRGCQTCVDEMEADGTNQRLREEDEFFEEQGKLGGPLPAPKWVDPQEARDQKTRDLFWNSVRNRSNRND